MTTATTAAKNGDLRASRFKWILRRLARSRLGMIGGLGILVFVASAVFAPWLSAHAPTTPNYDRTLEGPSAEHWLGTDTLGRDTYTRTLWGGRVSLIAGVVPVLLALVIGTALGLVSGFAAGVYDALIMRAMDVILAFPPILFALAMAAVLQPGLENVIIAITIIFIPNFARLARGQVLTVRQLEYVQAARALGVGNARILAAHVLPNITAPILVQASVSIANAILIEASLSFLGFGVQPPNPSWGGMLRTAMGLLEINPWLTLAPGVAVFLAIMFFNFLGDGLRDALDVRLRSD